MKRILYICSILLLIGACKNSTSGVESKDDPFASAYPEMYKSLNLPEYRVGTVQNVTGKTEGPKVTHNLVIMTSDAPPVIKEFFDPKMKADGWQETNARRFVSSDVSDSDLYLTQYLKGANKFDINAATTPSGETKLRISLSVFTSN